MKKLIVLICTLLCLAGYSQNTIVGNHVIARKSVYTNNVKTTTAMDSVFELDVFPDIQNMVKNAAYQPAGRSMFDWVSQHRNTENIKAVMQLGDITNNCTPAEWDTASAWFSRLDSINMPYVAPPGNHDYGNGFNPSSRDDTAYNRRFGVTRFSGKSFYKGNLKTPGTTFGSNNNDNYWIEFNVSTRKYAVLALEFMPRDTVLTWANKLCDSLYNVDPERQVIVVTHAYITVFGELSTDTSVFSGNYYGMPQDNSGQEMWDKFIKLKPNIRYVLNGHFLIPNKTPGYGLHARMTATGVNGNVIEQIFVNFQDDWAFGNGYMMRMKFKPAQDSLNISFYSPYYNQNDSVVKGYSLRDPAINITASIGIAGSISVNSDLRVAGRPKFEMSQKGRVAIIGNDHLLTDTANFRYTPDSSLSIRGVGLGSNNTLPVVTMYQGDSAARNAPYVDYRGKDSLTNFQIRGYRWNRSQDGSIFIGDSSGIVATPAFNTTAGVDLTAFGSRALQSVTTGNSTTAIGARAARQMTTGVQSVYIGQNAGTATTTACCNTVVGGEALRSNVTGSDNTAIGQGSMVNVIGASASTAIGSNSLQNMVGTENVAMGKGALGNGVSGNYNTALGRSAGRDITGDANVFIGYYAGYGAGAINNRMYIDNNGTDAIPALMYAEFDNQKLQVNGKLGVNKLPAYWLDVLDSSTGQTTDSRVGNFSNAGATFNTTSSARNSYTGYFDNSASVSTGANMLTNYGIYSHATGPGTTNIAGYFLAESGANNRAIIVPNGGGNVGIGTSTPSNYAALELGETDHGFLGNRLNTTQQTALISPPAGLLIYNTDSACYVFFNGTAWRKIGSGVGGGGGTPGGSNTQVQYNNSGAFAGITGATSDGTNLFVPTLYGGSAASGNITISATSHATKGKILLGANSAFDETLSNLALGITNTTTNLTTAGLNGIVIKNTGSTVPGISLQYGSNGFEIYGNTGGELIGVNTNTSIQAFRISNANASLPGLYVGNSSSSPSAVLQIKAGTATANTAPLKFSSGTQLATPEAFVLEPSTGGSNLLYTDGSGNRASVAVNASAAAPATTGTMTTTLTNLTVMTITPTGACTFNASGGTAGQRCVFVITTSGTTSFTLTWGTNYKTTGTLATGTVTAKVFTVEFAYDGTNWNEVARTTAM